MEEQNINILDRIHASYYQLSAAERKVADYVLLQYEQVQFMSITQLATGNTMIFAQTHSLGTTSILSTTWRHKSIGLLIHGPTMM